ncbi:DUF4197 domain-containing protein [Psychroflexus aestuariivivens]|uniref:DUF4197 domain-containing protein n=1 Tax=Psychroflexus aestuariivivens TaxID=1795040 RepID=UPI000FDB8B1E|nr:DUF4197 domain-containing protein [Psychroflexus aestuariivivens]
MKKILLIPILLFISSCAELQQVAEEVNKNRTLSEGQIAEGLKQALNKGIDEQVTKLTQENGFYGNDLVKIGLPEELQKLESGLRKIGMGNLADEGIKALNRTAEEAVKEATPIFINAIQNMSINDAKNILLGDRNAATNYLKSQTKTELYNKFQPVVNKNFSKVGADQIWENIISKYNKIPLTENVNPDLTDYVTNRALDGVFTMIEIEEKEIRAKVNSRTTELLRRVFALQD